jgi:hypothetical protein
MNEDFLQLCSGAEGHSHSLYVRAWNETYINVSKCCQAHVDIGVGVQADLNIEVL